MDKSKQDIIKSEESDWLNWQTLTGAMVKLETLRFNKCFATSFFNPDATSLMNKIGEKHQVQSTKVKTPKEKMKIKNNLHEALFGNQKKKSWTLPHLSQVSPSHHCEIQNYLGLHKHISACSLQRHSNFGIHSQLWPKLS